MVPNCAAHHICATKYSRKENCETILFVVSLRKNINSCDLGYFGFLCCRFLILTLSDIISNTFCRFLLTKVCKLSYFFDNLEIVRAYNCRKGLRRIF